MFTFKISISLNTVALVILIGYLGRALLSLFLVPQYTPTVSATTIVASSNVDQLSHVDQAYYVHVMDKTTFDNDQHQALKMVPVLLLLFSFSLTILLTGKPIRSRSYAFHNLRYSYITFRIFRI